MNMHDLDGRCWGFAKDLPGCGTVRKVVSKVARPFKTNRILRHITFSYGLCAVYCVNVQLQGGRATLNTGGGAAFYARGPSLGWANLPAEQRNKCGVAASGAYKAGVFGSAGISSKDEIQWKDWEAGLMTGIGGGVAVTCGVATADFSRT